VQLTHPTNPRALELDYLDYLRLNELVHTEKYTPLAGTAHIHARPVPHGRAVEPVVIRPEFEHLRRRVDDDQPGEIETRKFEDIIGAMGDIQRAVVLGEPGAGKTTTLWKLARNLVDAAQADPTAPIPVLVRLGRWTNPDQPLLAFIAGELGRLGAHLDTLLSSERAVLLLDGLNEIPVAQREAKARQVRDLFTEHPALSAVVTCREQDYTLDLGVDRILITPLDPLRIREFVTRYLGDEQGEALFWRLAGERAYEYEEEFRMTFADLNPDWEHVFWSWREEILPEGFDWRKVDHERHVVWLRWEDWLLVRDNLGSLMNLARNPYMLLMMTDVYAHNGDLPANRGELFKRFVGTLLAREHITEGAAVLLQALAVLAYEMQVQRGQYQSGSAVTVLPRPAAARFLDERQFYQASSASLLSVDDEVRFTHQLLQEYFAATHMRAEIEAGRLTASFLWSRDRWWLRTNWEEAAVLLTGLYSADCSRVVDWMAVANPEVAALCITRSGAHTPPETLERLRVAWIPRLTDLEHDPQPEARAAVGRALGLLNLDNRPGVGLRTDGLPDIDWVEIREGPFRYQKKEWLTLPTFYISRYPITYRQFQAFIDAPDGFYNPCWWEGLAADDGHRSAPGEQAFKFWNHPRERVSWYDAVAFCRWLSAQLDDVVRLPTEQEWEKAACGTNGRKYPWGNDYIQGYANIDENYDNTGPHYLQQTSAVGIYPQGASPYGVMDMAGNVWEWCLNEYNYPENTVLTGDAARVGRGGAWTYYEFYARCVFRYRRYPDPRSDFIGFRVCVVAHPIL
ncbi:MAG TPA: SUMF1/EgtB/PvdO family nonheme iron enzyme, partial [Aggregatilineaceae bacterium]|nr:SUMF1/EgtB/PvdO family nonheme iron enzyme [Aggregatilineaceae bacterium]